MTILPLSWPMLSPLDLLVLSSLGAAWPPDLNNADLGWKTIAYGGLGHGIGISL